MLLQFKKNHKKSCHFKSQYAFAIVRLTASIMNFRYRAEKDQSRVLDMNPSLVRMAYERALLIKQFDRLDTDQAKYQEFIAEYFDKILDFRKERDWQTVPLETCQEFLKFPKVISLSKDSKTDKK